MRYQKVLTQKPTLSTLCLSRLKITVINLLCVFLESFHSLEGLENVLTTTTSVCLEGVTPIFCFLYLTWFGDPSHEHTKTSFSPLLSCLQLSRVPFNRCSVIY